jgi:hypothetical protein
MKKIIAMLFVTLSTITYSPKSESAIFIACLSSGGMIGGWCFVPLFRNRPHLNLLMLDEVENSDMASNIEMTLVEKFNFLKYDREGAFEIAKSIATKVDPELKEQDIVLSEEEASILTQDLDLEEEEINTLHRALTSDAI